MLWLSKKCMFEPRGIHHSRGKKVTFPILFFISSYSFITLFLAISDGRASEKNNRKKGHSKEELYKVKRKQMIETQILRRGITDRNVTKAMEKVERHKFIPSEYKAMAYNDHPLPIGHDQTISQPYIVAFMTEAAKLSPADRVLEIGTGSGYQAAVLAELVSQVFTIEIIPPLGKAAKKLLKETGYKNVFVRIGDGYRGWPEKAPFDAIIVTAAPNHIPKPLTGQLKTGGRLIVPVGKNYQQLIRLTKTKKGLKRESLLPVRFVPMTGEALKK